jgi:molybdopterin converting factor small subunit
MAVTFLVPGYLRDFTAGASRVAFEESPPSVRDALVLLWTRHPGVRDRVVTETGETRPHVNVFVGDESIRWTGGLDTPLAPGSEIAIVPAVSGG